MPAESTKLKLQGKRKELLVICARRIQPKRQWTVCLTQEINQGNIASYICGNKLPTLTRH
jgi:hypothetical protein